MIPVIIEQTSRGNVHTIYSSSQRPHHHADWSIEDNMANSVIAQLLSWMPKISTKDIYLYVNTPWWFYFSWFGNVDTMNYQGRCPNYRDGDGSIWVLSSQVEQKGKRFMLQMLNT